MGRLTLLGAGRPSGAAGAWTPAALPALWGWYKDAGLAGSDGDPLAQWDDASGNARHLTQGTSAKRPTKRTAIVNGRDVARFDGVDDFLSVAGALSQPVHAFVVVRFLGAYDASHRAILDETSGGFARWLGRNSSTQLQMYAGVALNSSATTPESWHYYGALWNGASSSLRADGSSIASGAVGSAAADGMRLAALSDGSECSNVEAAELVVSSAEVSGADLTNLEAYLASRFAL